MLFRTLSDAQKSPRPFASWKERVILKVTLSDGRVFYRSYEFDSTLHKCKACRNAAIAGRNRGLHSKLTSTGHICEICGNPYAGFVGRTHIINRQNKHEMIEHSWARSGRLH